jgi:hypothetical protein
MSCTVVSRDPFARQELVRRQILSRADGCAKCGNLNRNGKPFQYGTNPDRIVERVRWHAGAYCCVGCHNAHHKGNR